MTFQRKYDTVSSLEESETGRERDPKMQSDICGCVAHIGEALRMGGAFL